MVSIEIKVREIIRLDRAYQIECEADANAAFVQIPIGASLPPPSAHWRRWESIHADSPCV